MGRAGEHSKRTQHELGYPPKPPAKLLAAFFVFKLFRVSIKSINSPLLVFFTNNQQVLGSILAGDNTQQGHSN